MTSTTSSNNRASLLYKWALRRNRSMMIVFSILMIVGILIDINGLSWLKSESPSVIDDAKMTIGMISLITAQVGAIFMTLISSLITFSFLHNKRSVDMYGSIPVKRETVFITHLLASITAVGVPFILGSLVVIGITASSATIGTFLLLLLFGILGIISSCIFTVLMAYCCGTTIDTIITAIGFSVIYSGIVGLYWTLMSNMIPGVDFEQLFTTPIIALLCPYAFCFFSDAYKVIDEGTSLITMLVWMVIYTVAMFFLAFRMSKRRKAEIAQGGFAVNWIPLVVKAGASIVCGGLVGGIAAASSSESGMGIMVLFSLWYLIMGAAAFVIVNIIIERGFKGNFKKSAITYACTTAVFLTSLFALTTGLGIDTYVPVPENVKSAQINYDEMSTDPENIKTITEIHKSIAESIHNSDMRPYYPFADNSEFYYYTTDGDYDKTRDMYPLIDRCVTIRYKKNVGFSTYRSYYINPNRETAKIYDFDKLESLLEKYYSSEEYKRTQNTPIWNSEMPSSVKIDTSNPPTISYQMYMDTTSNSDDDYYYSSNYTTVNENIIPYNKTFLSGLYSALREDILADNEYYTQFLYSNGNENRDILGESYITLSVNYNYNSDYFSKENFETVSGWGDGVHVIIKDSYVNTRNYLKEHYIETEVKLPEKYASEYKMSASGYMEYLNRIDSEKVEGYIAFGQNGKIEDLLRAVDAASELMEGTALTRMGSIDDFDAWHAAHGKEFKEQLLKLTQTTYNNYPLKFEERPEYTNDFMTKEGLAGNWYYMEDMIFGELDNQINQIVIDINKSNEKPSAVPETNSTEDAPAEGV